MNRKDISGEMLDRLRRIETKLTRFVEGEPDQGVRVVDYQISRMDGDYDGDYELRLKSCGVTLTKVKQIMIDEGLKDKEVFVLENGIFICSVAL